MSEDETLDFWLNSESMDSDISEDEIPSEKEIFKPKKSPKQKENHLPTSSKEPNNSQKEEQKNIENILDIEPLPNKIIPDFDRTNIFEKQTDFMVKNLNSQIEKMKNEIQSILIDNEEEDSDSVVISQSEKKGNGDKVLWFVDEESSFRIQLILHEDEDFINVFKKLPEKYQEGYLFVVDGIEYEPENLLSLLLDDYSQIIIREKQKDINENEMRLAFLLPNGEKKRISTDKTRTFGEVLEKLGYPNSKAYFDGEQLSLTQRICDNDEIEDEFQIDVK